MLPRDCYNSPQEDPKIISTTQSGRKKSVCIPSDGEQSCGGKSRGSEANESPRNRQDESKLEQLVSWCRGAGEAAWPLRWESHATASLLMSRRLWVCQGMSAQPGTGMAAVPAPGTTRQRACCTGWSLQLDKNA